MLSCFVLFTYGGSSSYLLIAHFYLRHISFFSLSLNMTQAVDYNISLLSPNQYHHFRIYFMDN
jgi:hypothetical protein